MKIVLKDIDAGPNPTSEELAKIIAERIGLMPRKQGSTEKMHNLLLELYERAKVAYREKKPEHAVLTVEEMGMHAGITRQTMYDYLKRWLHIGLIVKTTYIKDGKVIIGYKLNGNTLDASFDKAVQKINNNLETTKRMISELQRTVKNEKISQSQRERSD